MNLTTIVRPAVTLPEKVHSSWPRYEDDEIEAVAHVLREGRVNALVHGEENAAFEREFAQFVGMPRSVCVANGTLALELALRALGVGPGDHVIVPARSFFATASCVLAVGATPIFADVDPASQNIDPASIERLVTSRTRAIICVHLAGLPCNMAAIAKIAKAHGLFVVEDCAQAHGARIGDRKVGSFGDAACFSFCTDKIISTGGEGGMILFRNAEHFRFAWQFKDHGKDYRKFHSRKGVPGRFRYLHDHVGSNFRLTEMQAAIGRLQLRKLPHWLARRQANAACLSALLKGHPDLIEPQVPAGVSHAWYKYYVQLAYDGPRTEARRNQVIDRLQAARIPCGSGSCPDMSREAALINRPVGREGDLPNACALGRRTIMFPVDHTLEPDDMERIAEALITALAAPR